MSFWDGSRWVADLPARHSRAPGIARRLVGATAEAGLISVLIFGLIASSAFAAKGGGNNGTGGHGHHGGGGGGYTATVAVSPNPVPGYSTFQITGCGYTPSVGVQLNLYAPGVTAVWGGMADATGCLYNATGWANAPGSARLDVLAGSTTVVASVTFTIQ